MRLPACDRSLKTPSIAALLIGAGGLSLMVAHAPTAAVAFVLLGGFVLAFASPRFAWLGALIVWGLTSLGALLELPGNPAATAACCPPASAVSPSPAAAVGALLAVAGFAAAAGYAASWIVAAVARIGKRWAMRGSHLVLPVARGLAIAGGALIVLYGVASVASPLQPYGLNERYCWDEFCFKVLSVNRVKALGPSSHRAVARGEFYVVSADMQSPWWGRFVWNNGAVVVMDYSGRFYKHAGAAEAALGGAAETRSRCHEILGASERETIVFDLPTGVVQPRLLLRDTLGVDGFIGDLRRPWRFVRPAFNLRYD